MEKYIKLKAAMNVIVVFILILTVNFSFSTSPVKAVSYETVTLGHTYQRTINGETLYKFTLPSDGKVTVSIKNSTDQTYRGEIISGSGSGYVYQDIESDTSNTASDYTTESVGQKQGSYYLLLDESGLYDGNYTFTIEFQPLSKYEKEYNDTIVYANPIDFGKTIQGILNDKEKEDEDFYKFTLPKAGNVKLAFAQKYGVTWNASILNSSGDKLADGSTEDGNKTLGNMNEEVGLPAGTYYIDVSADFGDATNIPYAFNINYSQGDNYEKEFNNYLGSATAIQLNTTINGAIQDYNDTDYYQFYVPKTEEITLEPKQTVSTQWDYEIINGSNNSLLELTTSDETNKDASRTVTLNKGTYYLNVSSNYYYGSDDPRTPYYFKLLEKTPRLSQSQVKFINNSGKTDIISISGLKKYDFIDVYNSRGTRLVKAVSGGSTKTLYIKQLSPYAGKVYINITHKGMIPSGGVGLNFGPEQTPALKSNQVTIYNNKENNWDKIFVWGLKKGDTVRVYNASGKYLGTKSFTSSNGYIYLKQIGNRAGKLQLTVQHANMDRSSALIEYFKAE